MTLAGVPLRGSTAWVPSTGPIGVGLSLCSYAGEVQVGVAVDEALVPDSEAKLSALAEEVATRSCGDRSGSADRRSQD